MNTGKNLSSLNQADSQKEDQEIRVAEALEEYLAALERGEAPDRQELLAKHPGITDQLLKCLEGLEVANHIGNQIRGQSSASLPQDEAIKKESILGDFRILYEVGRGGMGIVYAAEQISLPRKVALKILPFAAVLDSRQLERFKNEARAAATLDHSSIVSIYSVGCERGVHYFAMQYIEGQSLAEVITELQCDGTLEKSDPDKPVSTLIGQIEEFSTKCDGLIDSKVESPKTAGIASHNTRNSPSSSTVLKGSDDSSKNLTHKTVFFRYVARVGTEAALALDHAHARGIIHRDVKPGNLMLDIDGKVHIADFGLAQIEADAGITMSGDVLGTLRYMSPEQALAQRAITDHRTDIYSLGVTLYELITLKSPLEGEDRQELFRKITVEEPVAPRKLNASLPVDLETIILKAMAKNPTDRYPTAQDMADDLRRFLNGEPVRARRIGPAERLWRWSKRNPIIAALATLVAIVAVVGYARTNMALVQVSQERDEAIGNLYVAQMRMAQKDWEDGQIVRLQETLHSYLPDPGEPDLRGWEWYFHLSRIHSEKLSLRGLVDPPVHSIVWNSDGTQLAAAGRSSFKLWEIESRKVIASLPRNGFIGCLYEWEAGSKRFAWQSENSKTAIEVQFDDSKVTIDTETKLESVAWCPEGSRIATSGPDNSVKIWNTKTGQEIQTLQGHDTRVRSMAWSPDGNHLAAMGYEPGTISIWAVESGKKTATFKTNQFNWYLAWNPDNRRLAVGTYPGYVFVWDVINGEKLHSFRERGEVRILAWSPNGRQLALGLDGSTVSIRDANTGQRIRTIRHGNTIQALAWNPNGKWLAVGDGTGGPIKIWDTTQDQGVKVLADDVEYGGIEFSPNDLSLAYWATDHRIKVRDLHSGELLHDFEGPPGDGHHPLWSPAGNLLAAGGDDGSIYVYDLETNEVRNWLHEEVTTPFSLDSYHTVYVTWHPNGKHLTSVSQGEPITRTWDASSGEQLYSFNSPHGDDSYQREAWNVSWSSDGKMLATTGGRSPGVGGAIKIWDRAHWRNLHTIESYTKDLEWSFDNRYLAAGEYGGSIKILDAITGRISQSFIGHTGPVFFVIWSKDGKRLATSARDGVRMWNPLTGKEVFSILDAKALTWSHDRKMVATFENGKVRIYDASIGYDIADSPNYRRQSKEILRDRLDTQRF